MRNVLCAMAVLVTLPSCVFEGDNLSRVQQNLQECDPVAHACGNGQDGIMICHVPSGNSDNPQSLCISSAALLAHHDSHGGDFCGPCDVVNPSPDASSPAEPDAATGPDAGVDSPDAGQTMADAGPDIVVDAGMGPGWPDAGLTPSEDDVVNTDDRPNFGVEGGGCAAGSGAGLVLSIFVALLLFFRKYHTAVVLSVLTFFGSYANAQVVSEPVAVNTERFSMPVDDTAILNVDSGATVRKGTFSFFGWFGYSNDSLVLVNKDTGERAGSLIGDRFGGTLGVAYALTNKVTLAADLPYVLSQGRDLGTIRTSGELSEQGLGNLGLSFKVGMASLSKHPLNVALLGRFALPTNTGPEYLGSDSLSVELGVSAGRYFSERLYVAGQMGVHLQEFQKNAVDDLTVGEEIFAKVGAAYTLCKTLELGVTFNQAADLSDDIFDSRNRNYTEMMAGITKYATPEWTIFGLLGRGLNEGYGSPDFRAVVGLRFQRAPKKKVHNPPVLPPIVIPPPAEEPPPSPKIIILPGSVFFKFNSAELTPVGVDRINKLADDILATGKDICSDYGGGTCIDITVTGHTDSIGSKKYNLALGHRRAKAVVDALYNRGIVVDGTYSKGEEEPRASNKTKRGRAANRRVEIKLEGYEHVDRKDEDPDGSTDDHLRDR